VRNNPDTDAQTGKRRSVEIEIASTRWGSDKTPSVKVIEVPMIGESAIRLDITVDIRKTDTIEIRPVRRDMDDVDGLVEDAERLANS
jgi:hypothetical protein